MRIRYSGRLESDVSLRLQPHRDTHDHHPLLHVQRVHCKSVDRLTWRDVRAAQESREPTSDRGEQRWVILNTKVELWSHLRRHPTLLGIRNSLPGSSLLATRHRLEAINRCARLSSGWFGLVCDPIWIFDDPGSRGSSTYRQPTLPYLS
jgi:hypothetical protein